MKVGTNIGKNVNGTKNVLCALERADMVRKVQPKQFLQDIASV